MNKNKRRSLSLALFCQVVDNYGDIGICWRLARQLHHEHGVAVTLWVDNLCSFRRICPDVDVAAGWQQIEGVTVRHWRDQGGMFSVDDVADVVIEFFGCHIPPAYIEAMAQRTPRPVWLNLEGLTAEQWVEGCHTLPSMHPRLPLTKYFFFPGFTAKTGGLLHESALQTQRRAFQTDCAVQADFLTRLGLTAAQMASFKVSLFCYAHAPVAELFAVWQQERQATICLVPEGVAVQAVQGFMQSPAVAGAVATRGALTVRVLPFMTQPDYDRLLWACDLNMVRGEDSFVRAQWAARPFVWHIYPQEECLHHKKLRAFLQKYADGIDALALFSLFWNDVDDPRGNARQRWAALQACLPVIATRAQVWQTRMTTQGDLVGNLLHFVRRIQSDDGEKSV